MNSVRFFFFVIQKLLVFISIACRLFYHFVAKLIALQCDVFWWRVLNHEKQNKKPLINKYSIGIWFELFNLWAIANGLIRMSFVFEYRPMFGFSNTDTHEYLIKTITFCSFFFISTFLALLSAYHYWLNCQCIDVKRKCDNAYYCTFCGFQSWNWNVKLISKIARDCQISVGARKRKWKKSPSVT